MSDLGLAIGALSGAHNDYRTAEAYYDGDVDERFSSNRLSRAIMKSGMDTRFNFAKKPVEAVADRLEVAAISSEDAAANAQIQEMWEGNALGLEAPLLMRNACRFGDAYLIVWPSDDGTDEADAEPAPTSPVATGSLVGTGAAGATGDNRGG